MVGRRGATAAGTEASLSNLDRNYNFIGQVNEEVVGARRIIHWVVTGIFSLGPSHDAFIPLASFPIQRQQHVASDREAASHGLGWPRTSGLW